MSKIENTNPSELSTIDFEVIAVYGAQFEPENKDIWDKWFKEKLKEPSARRKGWTPIYRDHISTISIDIETCKDDIKVEHPDAFESINEANSVTVNISRQMTIREDGGAAITIQFKAKKRNETYSVRDILAILLLAPRMRGGDSSDIAGNISELRNKDILFTAEGDGKGPREELSNEISSGVSDIFKLFQDTVNQIQNRTDIPKLVYEPSTLNSFETSYPVEDTQIPSFGVFATLPSSLYRKAFLEDIVEDHEQKLEERKKHTQDIASILLRWLKPQNIKYVSIDFLESLGLLKDDAFVNRYMNSLSFVTYSSTGTICFKPEEKDQFDATGLAPQEATYWSIRSCIESSRLRWHHAIRLNYQLDELTKEVVRNHGKPGFESYLSRLLVLRAEAAIHFLDPLTYQWDATVGADIAKFMQGDVIERIEHECMQKLDTVKKLIHESLDVYRVQLMQAVDETE